MSACIMQHTVHSAVGTNPWHRPHKILPQSGSKGEKNAKHYPPKTPTIIILVVEKKKCLVPKYPNTIGINYLSHLVVKEEKCLNPPKPTVICKPTLSYHTTTTTYTLTSARCIKDLCLLKFLQSISAAANQ